MSSSSCLLKVAASPTNVTQDNNSNDIQHKSIFIGGLPSNTTRSDLYVVVKEFGSVHTQEVQLKTYEDGYCCGFVHFQVHGERGNSPSDKGAGYVAQYLQSSSEEKDNLQVDNKNLLHQLREKVCPFHKLAQKRAKKEVSDEGVFRFRQLNLDSSDCTSDEKDSIFPSSTNYECAIQSKPEEYTSTRNKDSGGPFNSTGLPNGMALSSQNLCCQDSSKIPLGIQSGMALLYVGIISSMMSAVIANRREIEKVNEKLKWTKNLVLELEEELNKKEIANDDYENPNLNMSAIDEPIKQTNESSNHVAAEKHELMSEIEAELEAELERLEMSLKVSSFERISDFVELDPEDEINVAQGDLKLDCFNVQSSDTSESYSNTSGTWIVHSKPDNYPVSPRELSSRLHEVIESRLEARIKELETALLHSQNRDCSLETQHNLSQKDFASRETESSACLQSPYWYHETDEETIKIVHGSENAFDIDTSIPPFDGGLIDSPNEKKGNLVHKYRQPTLMQLLKIDSMAQTRELQVTRKQHYHCSKVPIH